MLLFCKYTCIQDPNFRFFVPRVDHEQQLMPFCTRSECPKINKQKRGRESLIKRNVSWKSNKSICLCNFYNPLELRPKIEQFPYFSLVPSDFQSALSILAHMKLLCYCFVDFKAQLTWCFEFKLLWHLLVENTVNYCGWWKTRACVTCFFSLFFFIWKF